MPKVSPMPPICSPEVDSNKTVFGPAPSRYTGRTSIDKQASTISQSSCLSPVNKGLSDFNVNLFPVFVRHIMVALFLFGSCALSSTALTFVAQGSGNVGRDAELPRGMGAGSWDICARGNPSLEGSFSASCVMVRLLLLCVPSLSVISSRGCFLGRWACVTVAESLLVSDKSP